VNWKSGLFGAMLAASYGIAPASAQVVDGAYSVTLTLVDGIVTSPCRSIPNAERTMTISGGTVSMMYSPRGAPFKGTVASDGTIAATTRSPSTGTIMNLTAKLDGTKLSGAIVGDGGCRFDLKGTR
jgi:hypothetical protein